MTSVRSSKPTSLALVWTLVAALPGAGCTNGDWPSGNRASGGLRFVDRTESSGIDFHHVCGGKEKDYILEVNGGGVALFDHDGDGDLDVFLVNGSSLAGPTEKGPRDRLYRNDGNWKFTDVTADVGLDDNNQKFSLAATWEDYDLDGDQDLYVANDFGRNNLYRNDDGHFTDVSAAAGVEDISAGMGVSWGDFDEDGWPDLYVSNMFSSAGKRVTYQRQFQADAQADVLASFQRHARGNSLFKNRGDGSFEDVSVSAGVTMGRWSWGSEFVDIDNDGRQDLVVGNGFVTGDDPHDL
jgi:hypothetical protein